MSNIPERIYLQWHGDEKDPDPNAEISASDVSWCQDKIYDSDIEYVRAPAWHDKPTEPGLWVAVPYDRLIVVVNHEAWGNISLEGACNRWFGPLPADVRPVEGEQ